MLAMKQQQQQPEKKKEETAEERAKREREEDEMDEALIIRMADPRYIDVTLPDGTVRREFSHEMLMRLYGACWINTGFCLYLTDKELQVQEVRRNELRQQFAAQRAARRAAESAA